MKKILTNCCAAAIASWCCIGVQSVGADLIVDPAVVFGWQSAGAGTDTMRGWVFQTLYPVEVTALGMFDHYNPSGFLDTHIVQIWDANEQVVASALLPTGTTADNVNNCRYVEISPVVLPAGETIGSPLCSARWISITRSSSLRAAT